MNNIIKRVWNQNRLVNIEDLTGMVFQAEDGGHTFEISGVDDTGAAVSISGTVSGSFIRPDNTTVALTGETANGKASLTLTDECYEVPGRFGLAVFVAADGKKTVVYSAIGTVARTSTGTVPSGTAATVEELLAAVEAAMQELDDVAEQTAADAAAAQAAAQQIENMTVEAQTLAPGSSATVEKTTVSEVVHLRFGIPRGAPATISSWSVKYQASTSGTTIPTGAWLDNPPTIAPGSYLWSRTVVSYSDGTTTTSYSVSRMGIDGSGAVSTVCGVAPDGSGNVQVTAADVSAVPVSGADGFLYRLSNAIGQKQLMKSLWSDASGWNSGNITVNELSNYRLFMLRLKDTHMMIFAAFGIGSLDTEETYLRGIGGYATSGGYGTAFFSATRSGNTLTFVAAKVVNQSGTVTDHTVIEIIGVI